ncbi:hypothetical protein GCM10010191_79050 [Actinomadura vinacea]|uniref:Uncharacterized protein n=1 Tax=Actinomadura vinacea TaxID=115336 RepID=A0ABN3K660_9ACTN
MDSVIHCSWPVVARRSRAMAGSATVTAITLTLMTSSPAQSAARTARRRGWPEEIMAITITTVLPFA